MSDPKDDRPDVLEVQGLTMRFRGLTAVDKVDLRVKQGEIFAVIGPNGAGKTTVFNAITGIYEPTEGVVRMEGRDLQKQLERSSWLRWAISGLLVGIGLLLFIADIDGMWAATVKANYRGKGSTFQIAEAMRDLVAYMKAEPRVEFRSGRLWVVSYDGKLQLASAKNAEEAETKRLAAVEIGRLGSSVRVEEREDGAVAIAPDGRVLDRYATIDQAQGRVEASIKQHQAAASARTTRVVALLLGLVLGFTGAWAVWRQTRRTPTVVALRGIARTFQNIRLFQDMTVLENVLVGMDRHLRPVGRDLWRSRARALGPVAGLIALLAIVVASLRWQLLGATPTGVLLVLFVVGTAAWLVWLIKIGAFQPADVERERAARKDALELLAFVGLAGKHDELSRNLAYGDQRRLEIARALATKPRLLLLDEPAAGMNPAETVALMKLIREIRDRGVTVLLIEHHMRVVMGISDRIAVLVYGKKIAEGTPAEIKGNPEVVEAYLGKETLG